MSNQAEVFGFSLDWRQKTTGVVQSISCLIFEINYPSLFPSVGNKTELTCTFGEVKGKLNLNEREYKCKPNRLPIDLNFGRTT